AVKHPGVINIARASMSVANILTSGSLYDDSDVLDDREWVSIFSRRYSAFLVELLSPYVTSRIPVSTDGKHRLYVVRRGDIEISWATASPTDTGYVKTRMAHKDQAVAFVRDLLWKAVDPNRILLVKRGDQYRVESDPVGSLASSRFAEESVAYLR